MTVHGRKSYNIGAEKARKGLIPEDSEENLDDMEVVEALDLNPGLAYTPSINKAAADAKRQRNIRDALEAGVPKGRAIAEADKAYNEARKLAREILGHSK